MRIVKLQAENVKKLKAVEIIPEGNVVKITGKNEQGKTTVLDSIWWALTGTKNIQEQPIRKGEKFGSIKLDLGEFVVIRTFTETGSYLKVETQKGGATFKSPQAMLDNLIGKLSFDPLAFAKADKAKQTELLLSVIELKPDFNRIKEIAGYLPPDTSNPLNVINQTYKFLYDERTVMGRDLERTKKVIESYPEGLKEVQVVSIAELVAEKEKLEAENRANDDKREEVIGQQNEVSFTKTDIQDIEGQIATLQEKLQEFQAKLKQEEEKLTVMKAEADKLQDNDLTEINAKIAAADDTNTKATQWREFKKTAEEAGEYQKAYDYQTKQLEAIKAYKQELVSATKFPVEGLDFAEGGVMYQGLPFEQASSAQKLQVSLAIAMKLNPELRVIRIDDGSLLDSSHMKIIEDMAKENDFQVWMEMVDESGKVGIYIEDGEVVTPEAMKEVS